jgi:hypothetical protein
VLCEVVSSLPPEKPSLSRVSTHHITASLIWKVLIKTFHLSFRDSSFFYLSFQLLMRTTTLFWNALLTKRTKLYLHYVSSPKKARQAPLILRFPQAIAFLRFSGETDIPTTTTYPLCWVQPVATLVEASCRRKFCWGQMHSPKKRSFTLTQKRGGYMTPSKEQVMLVRQLSKSNPILPITQTHSNLLALLCHISVVCKYFE